MSTTAPPQKPKRDPLAGAKTDAAGQAVTNPREHVVELVADARKAYPNGLPTGSPFASAPRDRLYEFANTYHLGTVCGMLAEDELRVVLQHAHAKDLAAKEPPHIHEGETMRGPMPAGPTLEPDRIVPVKGVESSPINAWKCIEGRRCSLNGQMFWIERGAIVRAGDYLAGQIQLLVNQGLQLRPLTEE